MIAELVHQATGEFWTFHRHGVWGHAGGSNLTSTMSMFDLLFSLAEKDISS